MLMPIHACDVDWSQVERSKDRSKGVPFDRKNEQSLPGQGEQARQCNCPSGHGKDMADVTFTT
jgi:hypothetical protein